MTEPRRWLDDPEASDELKHTLDAARRPRSLDRATRARVGTRLGRLGVVPLSAITWLSIKSAAALGLAGGATVASAMVAVERYQASHAVVAMAPSGAPVPQQTSHAPEVKQPPAGSPEASEPDVPVASPTLNPPAELPRTELPRAPAPSATAPGGLAEESALLEQARRALGSAPSAALSSVREHARRFPNGQLAAERSLIEVDALYRMGHGAEARALAERLLSQGGGDLYVGRVQRLLQKIDGDR
jgi:hypothetical protein